jgi:hypothetical protein
LSLCWSVLYPLSLEKALSRLPKEPTGVETAVQGLLLEHLSDIKYNPPATTLTKRPSFCISLHMHC